MTFESRRDSLNVLAHASLVPAYSGELGATRSQMEIMTRELSQAKRCVKAT